MIVAQSAATLQSSFGDVWFTVVQFVPAIIAAAVLIIIVFLIASLEVLGLVRVTIFLQQVVLMYLPQVIVAVLIIILAAIVAEVVRNIVIGSAPPPGAGPGEIARASAHGGAWGI